MGANTSITEGTVLREGAILGSGINLTRSVKIYDAVNDRLITSEEKGYLEVPAKAVLVPGTRAVGEKGYSIATPIILKYEGGKDSDIMALEQALR